MGCRHSTATVSKNEHGRIISTSFRGPQQKTVDRLNKHGSSSSDSDAVRASLSDTRFLVHISHIKGRNLVPKDVASSDPYVIFNWDGTEHKTSVKPSNLHPVWEDSFHFFFECDVRDLTERRLNIEVIDYNTITQHQSIGTSSFTLHEIATGPVHYDIALLSQKNQTFSGRLAFNIVMKEYARWPIAFKGVRIVMNHAFLNHTLDSLAKTGSNGDSSSDKDGDDRDEIEDVRAFSKRSFTFKYDFNNPDHKMISNTSPVQKEPENPFGNVWTLIWKGYDLPGILSDEVAFSDVLSSTIRVELMDIKTYFNKKITVVDDVWGQCWLQMDKMYSFSEKESRAGKVGRKTQFEEPLWFRGQKVGYVEGIMTFRKTPSLAQLISGVMTEDGIKTASPVIVGNQHKGLLSFLRTKKNNNLPKEAKTLGSLLGKMPKYSSYRVTHKKNVQHGRLTYYKRLKDMLNLILHTHKESMVSFVYSNHHAKQSAQELFLSIIDYFLSKLEAQSDDFVERRFLFRLILGTFRRGELADLSLLGFDPVAPSAFDANNNLIDERAVDIVLSARSLLTLSSILPKKLRFEGTDDEQYAFCAHVMAISIFRLPKFGECIVQSILSEDDIDKPLPEWEGRWANGNSKAINNQEARVF